MDPGLDLFSLGYGGVCLLMFLTQRSFFYFPGPAADPSGRLELQVEGKRVLVAPRPSQPMTRCRWHLDAEGLPLERIDTDAGQQIRSSVTT